MDRIRSSNPSPASCAPGPCVCSSWPALQPIRRRSTTRGRRRRSSGLSPGRMWPSPPATWERIDKDSSEMHGNPLVIGKFGRNYQKPRSVSSVRCASSDLTIWDNSMFGLAFRPIATAIPSWSVLRRSTNSISRPFFSHLIA